MGALVSASTGVAGAAVFYLPFPPFPFTKPIPADWPNTVVPVPLPFPFRHPEYFSAVFYRSDSAFVSLPFPFDSIRGNQRRPSPTPSPPS